eukprot:EST49060.1 Phosphopantetheine adenylyltransferase [Spironucleus salmonicida]
MSQAYVQKKSLSKFIQPFEARCQNVQEFLDGLGPLTGDISVVELNDPVGPVLELEECQLVVSKETEDGAKVLNRLRRQKGLVEMVVHICGVVEENGRKVSSSEIRESETSTSM